MALSIDEVRHVAMLARLSLTEEEEKKFAVQLSATLDHISHLNELDTSAVEPTSHALDIKNVFRDDEVDKKFDDGAWRRNAPAQDFDHLRVPRIIEE